MLLAIGLPKFAGVLETHAFTDIEHRYTSYVTRAVVLAFQVSVTLGVPVPSKAWETLLNPLLNVMVPETGPGEPEPGLNVTVNVRLCPAGIVNGSAGSPETENATPEMLAAVTVTAVP